MELFLPFLVILLGYKNPTTRHYFFFIFLINKQVVSILISWCIETKYMCHMYVCT